MTTRRLIDHFLPEHYELSLDIERPKRTFSGIVTIRGKAVTNGPLWVHAKDLTIETCHVNGKSANYSTGPNDELEIESDMQSGSEYTVTFAFSGKITDQMHGMYPCYFDVDGTKKELIATQFESHHAREVFPCLDEPEAKATFDVTLTTEPDVQVLGNMPVVSQREENAKLVTTFDTTPRMSSYLLAWVYGDLHKKSATTKNGVEINVWATTAQPASSLDFALDIAARTIDFFNEYFGVPYPLPKSDHVALPDFSSGAMENWGLITYREVALLAEPGATSVSSKHRIAAVIAHELSHQWFGNLVTMKWWNNLWLNESFANLMEYVAVDALEPEWNVWFDFASYETVMSLRRDATPGVQAVQVPVNHPDEISTLFDPAIVYAKGSRLIHMLERYVGEDAFRAGLQAYFKKHAYGNTTETDLWNTLSDASGEDIGKLMTPWISQPGYPVVHVQEDGLRQEQFFIGNHESSHSLWEIPLGSSNESLPRLLEAETYTGDIQADTRLNIDDSAHFITHYPEAMIATQLKAVADGTMDAAGRLQLLHEQTLLARGRMIKSADLIPLLAYYKDESAESVWDILSVTIGELKKFVEGDDASEKALKSLSAELATKQYARLGWNPVPNESESDTKLRATILGLMVYSEDPDVLQHATTLAGGDLAVIDPELRALVLSAAIRHAKNDELFNQLLGLHHTTHSAELQQDIASGITSTTNAAQIERLLELMTDPKTIRSQDVARWFVYLVRSRYAREAAWKWVQAKWDWIESTFGGDKSYDDYPRYAATGLVTRSQLEEYRAFFSPLREQIALRRVIDMGLTEIEARVDLIEADSADVRAALLNQ